MSEPAVRQGSGRDVVVPGASARLFGGGLFVAGTIVFASLFGGQVPAPALRFAGVAIVALGWSLALGLLVPARMQSPAWRDLLSAAGWMRSVPLPWFDRELSESSRASLARSLRVRPFALAGFVAVFALAAGALVGTRGLASPMTGTADIVLGERADAITLDAPTPGLSHPLGVTIELVDAALDPAAPSATLRLRRLSDGVVREHTLVSGERAIVGGRGVALVNVGNSGLPGRAEVTIDGVARQVTVGETLDVPGGSVTFAAMELNRLGQLGPAVRVVEHDAGGEVVREGWVYRDADAGFDGRHGGGRVAVELVAVAAAPVVSLRVTESVVGARMIQSVVVAVAVLLVVLLVLAARPVVMAVGRDGDRTLYVVGWTRSDDPVALHRDRIGWLDEAQIAELARLIEATRRSA